MVLKKRLIVFIMQGSGFRVTGLIAQARSPLDWARGWPIIVGSLSPDMMTRSLRSTVPSLRILSCSRIRPYSSASGRGGQPETYTSTGTTLSTPCRTLYVGNGPPAFEQLPIEITHFGSGI